MSSGDMLKLLLLDYKGIEERYNDDPDLETIMKGRYFYICNVLGWSLLRFAYLSKIVRQETSPKWLENTINYLCSKTDDIPFTEEK